MILINSQVLKPLSQLPVKWILWESNPTILFARETTCLRYQTHIEQIVGIEPTLIPDWKSGAPPFMRYLQLHKGLESNQFGEVLETYPIPYLPDVCAIYEGIEPSTSGRQPDSLPLA